MKLNFKKNELKRLSDSHLIQGKTENIGGGRYYNPPPIVIIVPPPPDPASLYAGC